MTTQPAVSGSPKRIVEFLVEHHAFEVTIEDRFATGAHGAYLARRDDGRPCVVKWFEPGAASLDELHASVRRVERLRAKGYPAPALGPVFAIPGSVVLVQEVMRGSHTAELGHELLDHLIQLNELQTDDPDVDRSWSRFMTTSLLAGCEDRRSCLHEPLRRHSPAARAMLDRIKSIGAEVESIQFPDADAVHRDFQHGNLLLEDGRLEAVIDWDSSRTGDRIFDLVTLGFVASVAKTEPGVEQRIWGYVTEHRDAAVVAAYVAHMALRYVSAYIQRQPANADAWLEISDRHLNLYA